MINLTVRYNQNYIYKDWLTPDQQVGIDDQVTTERFKTCVRQALKRWRHVKSVTLVPDGDNLVFSFLVEGDTAYQCAAHERMIEDLSINLPWLTYPNASAHAKALSNAIDGHVANHAVTLVAWLRYYGLTVKEAKDLINEHKDEHDDRVFVFGT